MKNEFPFLTGAHSVGWRLESSREGELVFYQLASGEPAEEKLRLRLPKDFAGTLVLNRAPLKPLGVPYRVVAAGEWMEAQKAACDLFHPLPIGLKLLAVTGTNGKTTTVDLCLQLGEQAGLRGLSVGTLGVRREGRELENFSMTTPGFIQLRQLLHKYGTGLDFAALEVSSHALAQDRVHGLVFVAGAWTNLTQDHLDYHVTMAEYEAAKTGLFHHLAPSAKLYTPSSQVELARKLSVWPAHAKARPIPLEAVEALPVFFRTRFNRENLECAVELVAALGVDPFKTDWAALRPPPGRFYLREWGGRKAVVDFAHTPDALDNICRSLKESFPNEKLTVLFGCGGDRDRSKRPHMAAAVARHADALVLTSDNPRSEDPVAIIRDILPGIPSGVAHTQEPDRRRAVREALQRLRPGEILLLAGKGHEDYIEVGGVKLPYSDIEELDAFVKDQGHG